MLNGLLSEINYAIRGLRRNPLFAATAVLSLALGIGANAAIFSLLQQVLLQPLPVRDPQQLVFFDAPGTNQGNFTNDYALSLPFYHEVRDHNQVFSGVLARVPLNAAFSSDGSTERAYGEIVSGNYFDVLGVHAALGRTIIVGDDGQPGAGSVAVLSYRFFERRFGGDPSILGRTIEINAQPFTVIGVAARAFDGLELGKSSDFYVPLSMTTRLTPVDANANEDRGINSSFNHWLIIFARIKPELTAEQAETRINVLFHQFRESELKVMRRDRTAAWEKRFLSGHLFLRDGSRGMSLLREQFATPLLVLMGFVALVLLIACVNLANLLMARSAARQKEIAIRLALGAGRSRIARQLLVESLLLACCGGALGLLLATWVGEALLHMLPTATGTITLSSSPGFVVLVFTFAITLFTGILFGLLPATQATVYQPANTMKSEASSVAGGATHTRVRKGLVTAQIGLSLLLVIGAVLFARSLYNLRTLDPGFRAEHLLEFSLDPSQSGYKDPQSIAFTDQLRQRLSALPGVQSVAAAETGLLTGSHTGWTIDVEGYQRAEGENMHADVNAVSPGYFSTLGVPILMGRPIDASDTATSTKVAVISEKAREYWFKERNPLGLHFRFGQNNPWIEIVGVVGDVKTSTLREQTRRFVYLPCTQDNNIEQMRFYVRASQDAASLSPTIRAAVRQLDPRLPVFDLHTMELQVSTSLYTERMVAVLSVFFAALAALLAAIGLYGVMAYTVARRTGEIGIRMALGANSDNVLWLVMREVIAMAVIGVTVALPVAVALIRAIRSQLYGLSPTDPVTFISATVALCAIALLAGFVPALRASRIDPTRALRYE